MYIKKNKQTKVTSNETMTEVNSTKIESRRKNTHTKNIFIV